MSRPPQRVETLRLERVRRERAATATVDRASFCFVSRLLEPRFGFKRSLARLAWITFVIQAIFSALTRMIATALMHE